jgi:hypothetical protein
MVINFDNCQILWIGVICNSVFLFLTSSNVVFLVFPIHATFQSVINKIFEFKLNMK